MNARGDLALIACRNGLNSAKILKNDILELKVERESVLNNLKEITTYDERQFEFIDQINKHNIQLIYPTIKDFEDGEISIKIEESVRGTDAYIIQNTLNPEKPQDTSHNIMELILMTETVKRSSARNITIILPYLSYSKQERRQGRQPISAKVIIDMLHEVGANKIITMDLHASAIEGFSKAREMNIENLYASNIILDYLINKKQFEGTFIAPDAGSGKMVGHYSKVTGLPLAPGYKSRKSDSHHDTEEQKLFGNVTNQNVAIVDDQIATGDTMLKIAEIAKKDGANKVYIASTHGMFLKKPKEKSSEEKFREAIENSTIDEIIITNTLPHSKKFFSRNPKIYTLNALKMFANSIYENHVEGSLSGLYDANFRKTLFGENHKVPK